MVRFIVFVFLLIGAVSCSDKNNSLPPAVIPDMIDGEVVEFSVIPINITTPDKGSLIVSMNNTRYKAEFAVVPQAQSNAVLTFATDSIINNDSREFANLGKDAIGYAPVGPNEITIRFHDGKKIFALFDIASDFRGEFGEALISTWRQQNDPAKPNQKAKTDISNFVNLFRDSNGSAPGTTPLYLSVTVSRI